MNRVYASICEYVHVLCVSTRGLAFSVIAKGDNDRGQFVFPVARLWIQRCRNYDNDVVVKSATGARFFTSYRPPKPQRPLGFSSEPPRNFLCAKKGFLLIEISGASPALIASFCEKHSLPAVQNGIFIYSAEATPARI